MTVCAKLLESRPVNPKTWLIAGAGGSIGSNLLVHLLKSNQRVFGLDNFATGHQQNLDEVQRLVSAEQRAGFIVIQGDIRNQDDCHKACLGLDYLLHQAALGSVPRCINDPITTNATNMSCSFNSLVAARDAAIKSFTYAASSSTYSDYTALPEIEDNIGKPLSPNAVTKYVNELYADVFVKTCGLNTISLRYFNVFGKYQDPNGAYAGVICKWAASMLLGDEVVINGDCETSCDFCFIENAVQANLLATTADENGKNEVYKVAVGHRATMNDLYRALQATLAENNKLYENAHAYRDFRSGDMRHSKADVGKAEGELGHALESPHGWYSQGNAFVH